MNLNPLHAALYPLCHAYLTDKLSASNFYQTYTSALQANQNETYCWTAPSEAAADPRTLLKYAQTHQSNPLDWSLQHFNDSAFQPPRLEILGGPDAKERAALICTLVDKTKLSALFEIWEPANPPHINYAGIHLLETINTSEKLYLVDPSSLTRELCTTLLTHGNPGTVDTILLYHDTHPLKQKPAYILTTCFDYEHYLVYNANSPTT